MHPGWLSNAFAIADREGGTALFVDSGADIGPLVAAVEGWGATPAAILRTHSHPDHVVHEEELRARFGIDVVAEPGSWEWGGLRVRGVPTPGHSDDMVAFVVDDAVVFTGDTLFKDAVGGGDLEQVRASVMDVFMALPDEVRVLPGHTDETTIGREREHNPFVRVWSGAEPEGTEQVDVGGRPATLVVWSPDYDGNGKAWVRFEDGVDAIVGGSRVSRR
ncbi:MAG: hydroxyacylglutathione hydrolase [Gaiellaceae bacterium]|jgi:glyoxylase-like metal-dependent hydrolase (beta-lactamase superfamily II)|nr:hydroxyacylglutathione hydrolase [Gaiellaceae bacterium]